MRVTLVISVTLLTLWGTPAQADEISLRTPADESVRRFDAIAQAGPQSRAAGDRPAAGTGWSAAPRGGSPGFPGLAITAIAVSRDGRFVATGSENGDARIFAAADLRPLFSIKAHAHRVAHVEVLPERRQLVTQSEYDPEIKVWELPTGRPILTVVPGDHGGATCLVDGTADLLIAPAANDVRAWPLSSKGAPPVLRPADAVWALDTAGVVLSLALSSDRRLLAAGTASGEVYLWRYADRQRLAAVKPYQTGDWVTGLQFTRDSAQLVTASRSGLVALHDISEAGLQIRQRYAVASVDGTWSLQLASRDREIVTAGGFPVGSSHPEGPGIIEKRELASGQRTAAVTHLSNDVRAVVSGTRMYAGDILGVRAYDLVTLQQLAVVDSGYRQWYAEWQKQFRTPKPQPRASDTPGPDPTSPEAASALRPTGPLRPAGPAPSAATGDVHAVGVYEGTLPRGRPRQSGEHAVGTVDVTVSLPDRPVTLVLTAYEPVLWQIAVTPGSRLAYVIVRGYHAPQVRGVPEGVPVSIQSYEADRNTFYLSGSGSEQVRAFAKQVQTATSREMQTVQYTYRGESISVDGVHSLPLPALAASAEAPARTGVPAEQRLESCEPSVALAAAEEIVKNPETLKEPLQLVLVSGALFLHGKKDEAVFWFYAAQLRVRYQLVFVKGDRGQIYAGMLMGIGPLINSYALQDTANLNRILDRVLEWDRQTPNPWQSHARSEQSDKQIAEVYAGLRDLKSKLSADREELERTARLAAPDIERAAADFHNRCPKTTQGVPQAAASQAQPDGGSAAQAIKAEWARVILFVKSHPEVMRAAGEIKQVYPETSMLKRQTVMPHRYIASVSGDRTVSAVVDVSRITGDVTFTLACISRLSPGKRDPFKDVCDQ